MDLEKLDGMLWDLYSLAVAMQDVVRLLRTNRLHGVDLPAELVAQLQDRARQMRSRLVLLGKDVDAEVGSA